MVINRVVEPVLASLPGNHVLPNQYYTTIKNNKTTNGGSEISMVEQKTQLLC
jgi:hypothetical protein